MPALNAALKAATQSRQRNFAQGARTGFPAFIHMQIKV